MAALPNPPLVSVEEYLATSYPDGDREYLDGVVVERNLGTLWHSRLQKLIIKHLTPYEDELRAEVLPECRTRVSETRYRVPDVVVALRPYQHGRVLVDTPFLVVEILSPEDRLVHTLARFRDYSSLGTPYIVLMDPESRESFVYSSGDLMRRDLNGFDVPGRGFLPFDSRELLAQLHGE